MSIVAHRLSCYKCVHCWMKIIVDIIMHALFASTEVEWYPAMSESRPFKIWNSDRSIKKGTVAATLEDLLKKGWFFIDTLWFIAYCVLIIILSFMFDKKHEEKNAGSCMVLFLPKFDQHFRSCGTCNLDKLYLPNVVRFSLRSEHGYCEISQVLVKVLKC